MGAKSFKHNLQTRDAAGNRDGKCERRAGFSNRAGARRGPSMPANGAPSARNECGERSARVRPLFSPEIPWRTTRRNCKSTHMLLSLGIADSGAIGEPIGRPVDCDQSASRGRRLDLDSPAMHADDPPAFGEPESQSPAGLAARIEWIEQMLPIGFRQSGPIVLDGK